MHILVTGAAGFIGSHLCERLLLDGHSVTGVDAFIPYYPRAIKEANIAHLHDVAAFRFLDADLRDADLSQLVSDADVVVHMAAMAGSASWHAFNDYVTCNLLATQRLLEALTSSDDVGQRKLIQISTSSVYGEQALGNEDAPLHPVNPYGVTKLAAEQLAFAYHRVHGLPVVALRYFSIYGPRQRPDMAYFRFIEAILDGKPLTIYGDGEQTRGNTYIADCIEGTVAALERGHSGEVYNLGGGVPISINEAIDLLEEAVGSQVERRHLPARPGDQRHTLADVTKAHDQLGYTAAVSPQKGLPLQVEWQRTLHKAHR